MLAKNLFAELEHFNLFTVKFLVLDYILEDVFWFGALNFKDASPFEHISFTIKKFVTTTSMKRGNSMKEAVKAIDLLVQLGKRGSNTGGEIPKQSMSGTILPSILSNWQANLWQL